MKKEKLKQIIDEPVYFLGAQMRESEIEKDFEDLFDKYKKIYITHSEEIYKSKIKSGKKCVLCDIYSKKNFDGSIFIPYGTRWLISEKDPVKRYLELTDKMFEAGFKSIIYSDIVNESKNWFYDPETYYNLLIKNMIDRDFDILRLSYRGKNYLVVKKYSLNGKNIYLFE